MPSPADLVIIVPVLRRPHRAARVAESVDATTPGCRLLFVGSPGDVEEHEACRATGADLLVIDEPVGPGDYARKINAGYRVTSEPVMLIAADDLLFHPEWFDRAMARMVGTVGVVGTNDLGNPRVLAGEHTTHPLVSRDYIDGHGTIDETGKVYCERYPHEFSDDEFVGTAKHRGVWAFAVDSIVEHLHPNWGKAPSDPLYDAQAQRIRHGRQVFNRRRHLWN